LRRATSDLYYAVFHAICEALVEPLTLQPDNPAFVETYTSLYRQLGHKQAETRCRQVSTDEQFPLEIRQFAKQFITLKNKREKADYHPLEQFVITSVKNDLQTTETRLNAFREVEPGQTATFACVVALRFGKDT